jgi:hypothetical protein
MGAAALPGGARQDGQHEAASPRPTAPTATPRQDDLARLVVRSATFTRTSSRDWDRQRVGPFDVERFVSKLSGTPEEDRQLLARNGFVRGCCRRLVTRRAGCR